LSGAGTVNAIVELHDLRIAAAFVAFRAPGVVDENMPHHTR
jgi:hypothetical protein